MFVCDVCEKQINRPEYISISGLMICSYDCLQIKHKKEKSEELENLIAIIKENALQVLNQYHKEGEMSYSAYNEVFDVIVESIDETVKTAKNKL